VSFALSPDSSQCQLLYGRSWSTIAMGEFSGRFGTMRLMATTKLEGVLGYGALTLRPNLKLT
jgi:hypothetical protein